MLHCFKLGFPWWSADYYAQSRGGKYPRDKAPVVLRREDDIMHPDTEGVRVEVGLSINKCRRTWAWHWVIDLNNLWSAYSAKDSLFGKCVSEMLCWLSVSGSTCCWWSTTWSWWMLSRCTTAWCQNYQTMAMSRQRPQFLHRSNNKWQDHHHLYHLLF